MKTLKDVEAEFYKLNEDGNFLNCLYRCRESAKEWIKELKKCGHCAGTLEPIPDNLEPLQEFLEIYNEPNESDDSGAMIRWIKYFFNLEE